MTFKQYQEDAYRTCAQLGDLRLDLSHMVLGITSEFEEFAKAVDNEDEVNIKEELADMFWYVANYCNFRSFDLTEIVGEYTDELSFEQEQWESHFVALDVYVSQLSDQVKKFMAYGKPLDQAIEKRALEGIIYAISLEGYEVDFSFDIDLQKNIDKLKVRYPEKFTNENAMNRDLDTERKVLTGETTEG